MKTAELTGALLDYWVAKAEGMPVSVNANDMATSLFRPSADWAQGGPIILREAIVSSEHPLIKMWVACAGLDYNAKPINAVGETILIAAMRAYVASKYGDKVPDQQDSCAKP